MSDSISTLGGYTEPENAAFYDGTVKFDANVFVPEDTWWGQVISHLGGQLLVNNSFSGSTVTRHPKCMIESYGCSDERTSSLSRDGVHPDVIFVWLGTNDWGCGVRPFSSDEDDLSAFSSAYKRMLEKLKRYYPDADIFCLTLSVNPDKLDTQKYPLSDYSSEIRRIAEVMSCSVIELEGTLISFDTVDGYHPNSDGMKAIAKAVITELEKQH